MKKKTLIIQLFLLFTIVLTVLASCGKDEESGYTDLNALNYAPDADIDNGTIEDERYKFFGTYSSISVCDELGPWHNINFQLKIISDGSNTQNVWVVFSHPSGNIINFKAKVEGNTLTINSKERVKPYGFCGVPPGHRMELIALATLVGNQLNFLYYHFNARAVCNQAIVCSQICDVKTIKN